MAPSLSKTPSGQSYSRDTSRASSDTELLEIDLSRFIKILYPSELSAGVCILSVESDTNHIIITNEKIIDFIKTKYPFFTGDVYKIIEKPKGEKIGKIGL